MIGAIIQARMGSSRLPNKVTMPLNGKTVLEWVVLRISQSKRIDKIIVATTTNEPDDAIAEICEKRKITYFRGSEDDVLARYYYAAKEFELSNVVRITADCPLIDAAIVDRVMDEFFRQEADYASNIMPPTYPDGLDCEVITFEALEKSFREANLKYEREHVTQYIRNHDFFRRVNVENSTDLSAKRWTLDEAEDYEFIKAIYSGINKEYFSFNEILEFLKKNPELELINNRFKRNEGLVKCIKEENII